ncbi:uncharacterized protein LOC142317568 [Lycorma delicatula]|uniref:uncharacterized protein LOC142317568 n=1 Tax=Lycorma delicatula TaxID=130591 RepID=UPI003F50F7A9
MQSEIFFVGLSNNMFSISTFLVLFLSHFFVSSIEADVFTEVTTPTVYTNNATSVDTVPFNVTSSIDSNHFTDDCDNRDGVCDSSRPIDATGNNGVNGTSSKAVTSTSNDSSPSSIIERTTSAVTNKLKTTNAPDVINATGTIFTNITTKTTTTTTELETKYTAHVEYCECDIMKDECDINCCCDEDCSSQDKQMFSYCSSALLADSLALSIDYRHCYTSHFLYDNNTKLLKVVKQNSHNLFCIAIDNLEPGLVYKTLPLVKSEEILIKC